MPQRLGPSGEDEKAVRRTPAIEGDDDACPPASQRSVRREEAALGESRLGSLAMGRS